MPSDPVAARITSALAEALAAGELPDGGMVDKFILVATYYNPNGESRAAFVANEDAIIHETLGLLDTAQAAYRAQAIEWVRGTGDAP